MERLLGSVAAIGETKIRCDDDFFDRLNHRYSTFILVVFAIVVSTKQYVGEPINCWCPAHFTDNHEDFTNKVCWVSNTYFVPLLKKDIPEVDEPKERIGYYQWVPMILLVQAMFFYLPAMVWRFMNNKAGVDVNNIVEAAMTLQHTAYADNRGKTLQFMAKHMDRYLGSTREYRQGCCTNIKHFVSRNCCLICGRKYGNYIVVLYLTVKMLYLLNVIGQLFVLNAFLGTNYHLYGYEVISKMMHYEDFTASERFPRVTLCDFTIRTLANIHRHTVQCVLPINLFNEKIYIFVWFWFVFVAFSNFISFVTWLARSLLRIDQARYVRHHLTAMGKLPGKEDRKLVSKFVTNYLKQDGILVLRLVGINSSQMVVAELLAELYNHWRVTRPIMNRDANRRDPGDIA